jgi:uncharacterized membrane protein HdeD (DUF308 family)
MFLTAIAFLSLSGVFGLCIEVFSFKRTSAFSLKVFAHGFVAITGLLMLFSYAFNQQQEALQTIILFVLAAIGGLVSLALDLAGRFTPGWMAVLHVIVSVCGFILLVLGGMEEASI